MDKDVYSDLLDSSNSVTDLVIVDNGGDSNGYIKICIRVFISYTGEKSASNVHVVPHVPNFVHCAPVNATFDKISGSNSTPLIVKFYMYARKDQIPTGIVFKIHYILHIAYFMVHIL